ncbi:MAG TPA: tetratricopeptide repeat protein [Longimicrobiales bacterium]
MNAPRAPDLLERVRTLASRNDHAGVVRLLEGWTRDALLADPELGYHAAYAWRRTGRTLEALDLVERLDVIVRRRADAWLIRRRLNLEAMLRFDAGDLPAAEQLWWQVVELADRDGDRALLAAAHNNVGVIQTLHDRTDDALATYNRALLASQQLGDRRGVAQAHQNLAILYREKERPVESEAHFVEAMQHARISHSEDVLGRAEEERALLLLDQGDVTLARAAAARALDRLRAIEDVNGAGEALRVLGMVALRDRALEQAADYLDHAIRHAREVHNPLLEAETEEALAALALATGDSDRARRHQADAERRFDVLSAEPWGRRVRERTLQRAGVT